MTVLEEFPALDVLREAGRVAGVDVRGASLIRDGSNVLYRLAGGVVARIGKYGAEENAVLEVAVSDWLRRCSIPAARTIADLPRLTMVGDRPVTWWELLPAHRPATTAELGDALRKLHRLPLPDYPKLVEVDPFSGLDERISASRILGEDDRLWLRSSLEVLRSERQRLSSGLGMTVVHGDAWQGNVVVPETGFRKAGDELPIMLDFENVGVGHPEWDLVSVGVDRTDFERISADEYSAFVRAYGGYDVTAWEGYRTLASIRELRWVCFVLGKADSSERAEREVRHRLACLRGEVPRPWTWEAF